MTKHPRPYGGKREWRFTVALLCSLLLWPSLDPGAAAIQKGNRIRSTVLDKGWHRFLFPEINERAKLSKLGSLKSSILPKDDLELRIWIGFGPAALEGFVLKRQNKHWSAMHLRSTSPHLVLVDIPKKLAAPKSGWEPFWLCLTGEGVLTLPDSGGGFSHTDSEAFVVEVREGKSYRTYMYDMPSETPEAKRLKSVVQIIRDEFNVPR